MATGLDGPGETCFLNRWRGLDAIEMRDQGIDLNSGLQDTFGGNLFHAILLGFGLVLCFAGTHFRQLTLWSLGFLGGGLVMFFLISFIFNNVPDLYSCYVLGLVPLAGGCILAVYTLKILGEEKVFELLGGLAGTVGGYFVYTLAFSEVTTGIEAMGRDLMNVVFIVGGAAVGYVLVGKIEYVRRNILMIYSALVGALLIVLGADYVIIAHTQTNFRPVDTTTANAQRNVGNTHATLLMVGGILLALGGYYFQLLKLRKLLVRFGYATETEAERAARLAAGDSASGDWQERTDPNTGKTYYYNSKGETRWDKPTVAPPQRPGGGGAPRPGGGPPPRPGGGPPPRPGGGGPPPRPGPPPRRP